MLIANGKNNIVRILRYHPKYIKRQEFNAITKAIYIKFQAINQIYETGNNLEEIKAAAAKLYEAFDLVKHPPAPIMQTAILIAALGLLDPSNPIYRNSYKDAVQAILDGLKKEGS